MPTYPVNPGLDAKAFWDGLETVAVESLDPDSGTTLATAANVTCLAGVTAGDEQGTGDGAVGFDSKSFWLVAADLAGIVPKRRDRVTDDAGVRWVVGNVTAEQFGTVYACRDCTRER